MPQWQWEHVRSREDVTCSGVTKHGSPCKLRVCQANIKEAYHKLNCLAQHTFDLSSLQTRLREIIPLLLCKRWHQDQADDVSRAWYAATCTEESRALFRGPSISVERDVRDSRDGGIVHQHATAPTLAGDRGSQDIDVLPPYDQLWPLSYQDAGRVISGNDLREKQVPWEITPTHPAILAVDNTSGGSHSVRIRSCSDRPNLEDVECRICLGGDRDESVVLQCEVCTNVVHLGCMEDWLTNRSSVNRFSCPICRGQQTFDAFHCSSAVDYTDTNVGNFRDSALSEHGSGRTSPSEETPRFVRSSRGSFVDLSTQASHSAITRLPNDPVCVGQPDEHDNRIGFGSGFQYRDRNSVQVSRLED
ncbi:hypothetical protein NUU61_001443 [Penicillium alfredii]|uniref:RING-type domain-containing protein n=1 Tax=Penicillium alfredii TaxID=1506179 RepID=A0A9W9G4H7_9EURO|nr:uncharacterized protein NUU61_001443 [Penicillium alfredii]KAJ5111813.1 hypothetical protein NUU61_001443 [Penicillium alfredii]